MSDNTTPQPTKTKWQQIMDAPKGCMEYNPTQTFALQVYWVVRSPKAAADMFKKGFGPCATATMRDTPTTLSYFFRVSKDQSLALKMKEEVKTIGQHPHYKPSFKSMEMGIPQTKVELKLKHGGIDVTPLTWKEDEPIANHLQELDFDPIVLECTEVYLDDRGFNEHAASRDWMKHYPEIMMASRSLAPTTYCLGTPSDKIWETTLDAFIHATRFTDEESKATSTGVYVNHDYMDRETVESVLYVEMDLLFSTEKCSAFRGYLPNIQKDLAAPLMIVLPSPTNTDNTSVRNVRIILCFPCTNTTKSDSLGLLSALCEKTDTRVIHFDEKHTLKIDAQLLEQLGLDSAKTTLLDGITAATQLVLAGYPLHPLFNKLTTTNN